MEYYLFIVTFSAFGSTHGIVKLILPVIESVLEILPPKSKPTTTFLEDTFPRPSFTFSATVAMSNFISLNLSASFELILASVLESSFCAAIIHFEISIKDWLMNFSNSMINRIIVN